VFALEGEDGEDERPAVQEERNGRKVLDVRQQVVHRLVRLADVVEEVPVRVEDADGEPAPLRRPEERDDVLDRGGVVLVVTDADQLLEEQDLDQDYQRDHVQVSQINLSTSKHNRAADKLVSK